jgi:hypothetical protein
MFVLLNGVTAPGASAIRPVGSADNNLVVISSAAGSTGTITVESSADGATWITELSVSNPVASPVPVGQRIYIPGSNFIRANATALSAGTVTAVLQSWRHGLEVN